MLFLRAFVAVYSGICAALVYDTDPGLARMMALSTLLFAALAVRGWLQGERWR